MDRNTPVGRQVPQSTAKSALDPTRGMTYPEHMNFLRSMACASSTLAIAGADPLDTWEWTLESGYLWQVGDNTAADYEIIPTQLTLRSPVVWTWWEGESGARWLVRNRFSLLAESFTQGLEDYYLGAAAAPSIEFAFPGEMTSLFFSIGGGAGWTNSAGGTDGQGQDLSFNWFTQLGVRRILTDDLSLLAGIQFIHHSNLGMTDPNPGIDALGFTLGCGWRF